MTPQSFPASVTQPEVQSDVPTNANEHCVGTESDEAGLADSCAGCPNQSICASLPKGPDPDLPLLQARLSMIKHKILVLSGKGGVGKSTFTAALSFALAADEEAQVGVMDIDITGPSLPRIMGVDGEQIHESASGWTPIYVRDNLSLISTAFLLPTPDTPIIWRGPKKNGMIKQFIKDVDWDELDFLVIDTPPGTSDEHLSISTFLRQASESAGSHDAGVDGAVIVTTPQEVALLDVRKELDFCRKAGIRVLGIVENMSGFVCPNCKGESKIFAATTGGARSLAKEFHVPFLGAVPLDPRIAKCCDFGESFVEEFPDSAATKAFLSIVKGTLPHPASRIPHSLIAHSPAPSSELIIAVRQQVGYTED